jgi:hypothetical protein
MEETTASIETSWFQDAAKKGASLAAIHILIFLIVYYLLPDKLISLSYAAFAIIFNLGFAIYHGRQLRTELGGFLSFAGAFKYAFVLLAVNGLIGVLFTGLFLLVEPAMPETMAEAQLNLQMYWAERMGAPEDALEEMRDKFNPDDITNRFSFIGLISSFGIGLIFYAIGALIVALFVKKDPAETI